MEEGREKQGGEDDRPVSSPASAASMVDYATNGARTKVEIEEEEEEEEEEEAKIEEFFRLLGRIREARREMGIVKSKTAKRGTSVGSGHLPWIPVFEMEDFARQSKRHKATAADQDDLGGVGGGGGGEEDDEERVGRGGGRGGGVDEVRPRPWAVDQTGLDEGEVSTRLDLGLGR